jgi:hypothetical protein
MNIVGKKLVGNGIWESSRMMLPEHKAAILEKKEQIKKKAKPVLDEQKWAEMNDRLRLALEQGTELSVVVFSSGLERTITGKVLQVDVLSRRINVNGEWINMSGIIDIHNSATFF